MACISCIAIPILLVIWRFVIQPLFTKWWYFKDKQIELTNNKQPPQLIKECNNGVCTLSWTENQDENSMKED